MVQVMKKMSSQFKQLQQLPTVQEVDEEYAIWKEDDDDDDVRSCEVYGLSQLQVGESMSHAKGEGVEVLWKAEEVEALWDGVYCCAVVVDSDKDREDCVKIHWVGYAADFDEWVMPDRIRHYEAKKRNRCEFFHPSSLTMEHACQQLAPKDMWRAAKEVMEEESTA